MIEGEVIPISEIIKYEDILPLSEVKNYLRIDSEFTEDDGSILRMIKGSLQFIEEQTNHRFLRNMKTYYKGSNPHVIIYDYPYELEGLNRPYEEFTGSLHVYSNKATLSIGYLTKDDIPAALIEAALQIIKVWYFEAEKQSNTSILPENISEVINTYKRQIIF